MDRKEGRESGLTIKAINIREWKEICENEGKKIKIRKAI
jgi:hypothetical protein